MNTRRLAIQATLSAVLIASLSTAHLPSANAAGAPIITPVFFTLEPAQCPDLTVTVSGVGVNSTVVNQRIGKDGYTYMVVNSHTTGTATDSNGASYVFNYHNNQTLALPPSVFPFEFKITDHFNLNGKGKANKLHIVIVARVTVNAPNDLVIDIINGRGNILCDPI